MPARNKPEIQCRRRYALPARQSWVPVHLCLIALLPAVLHARAADVAGEYEVKAAFLLKFTSYVEWPAQAFPDDETPFRIALLGSDPFGNSLDETFRDKRAQGRTFEVRRVKKASEATDCHIVYIAGSEAAALDQILPVFRQSHILTVGEDANFLRHGGIINFVLQSNKVRFEINHSAAEAQGLKLSADLLRVAVSVYREEEKADGQ